MEKDTKDALLECLDHLEWALTSIDLGHDIDEELLAKFSWDIRDVVSGIEKVLK